MNSKNPFIFVLSAAILGLVVFSAWQGRAVAALRAEVEQLRSGAAEEEDFELAEPMVALHRFMAKLHFAAEAENWPLAEFYLHELEEVAGEIIERNPVEEGIALGPLTQGLLLAVEPVREAVEEGNKAAFTERQRNLVMACNSCHQATRHGFIQVQIPAAMMFPDQKFSP